MDFYEIFGGSWRNPRNNLSDFGGDPVHDPDPGFVDPRITIWVQISSIRITVRIREFLKNSLLPSPRIIGRQYDGSLIRGFVNPRVR